MTSLHHSIGSLHVFILEDGSHPSLIVVGAVLGFLARSAISVSNLFRRETFLSHPLEACHRSLKRNDILEALMEGVLHDFGEHVGDGLADLGINAAFKVSLGVTNVNTVLFDILVLALIVAFAILVKVKKVIRADIVAITGVDFVLTFMVSKLRMAGTFRYEAFRLRETSLLAIELGNQEVTDSLEAFSVVPKASGSAFLTLVSICGCGGV